MYELLEDNLFYSDGDTSVIEKGEVIKVILLYDNGTVNCKYDGEYGYIDNAKIVLTDKNPPYFKSDEWYKLLYNILFGFFIWLIIHCRISSYITVRPVLQAQYAQAKGNVETS